MIWERVRSIEPPFDQVPSCIENKMAESEESCEAAPQLNLKRANPHKY